MNTEDDGTRNGADRGDAEQPQQPRPNGADQDAGTESAQGAATPPPADQPNAEPPVQPPPADQPSAAQRDAEPEATGPETGGPEAAGPEVAETAEPEAAETAEPEAADTTAADAAETAEPEAADTTAADAAGEGTADETPPADENGTPGNTADDADADTDAGAGAGAGPTTDEYARRLLDSVDGFLGNVFREASGFVDRTSRRPTPPPRADRERTPSEDYAGRVLDSVEGWMGDFFRGASMARTAAGFGRAAAGSAFRARQRPDDVWAHATSGQESDASRECRYCPFCQTMSVVRNSRPELYEQIGDTAKTLVDLIRQAAEQSRRPRR